MRDLATNCPNCGAPITDSVCPYCSTRTKEPSIDMAIGKPVTCTFTHDGSVYEFDMVLTSFEFKSEPLIDTYADDYVYRSVRSDQLDVRIGAFVIATEEDGMLVSVKKRVA